MIFLFKAKVLKLWTPIYIGVHKTRTFTFAVKVYLGIYYDNEDYNVRLIYNI